MQRGRVAAAIRPALQDAAAQRDGAGWAEILRLLLDPTISDEQRAREAAWLRRELAAWPVEVSRPPPKPELVGGTAAWRASVGALLRPLVRVVKEVDLYPLYIERICTSPRLMLDDGGQAVRLARAFTGKLDDRRIGQVGQGDLIGDLVVEYSRPIPLALGADTVAHTFTRDSFAAWVEERQRLRGRLRRLAVCLEIEVKTDTGRVEKEQAQRGAALRRRGALHLVVRRIDEAIDRLVEERDRITKELES